jgi:hypothetical protein
LSLDHLACSDKGSQGRLLSSPQSGHVIKVSIEAAIQELEHLI